MSKTVRPSAQASCLQASAVAVSVSLLMLQIRPSGTKPFPTLAPWGASKQYENSEQLGNS